MMRACCVLRVCQIKGVRPPARVAVGAAGPRSVLFYQRAIFWGRCRDSRLLPRFHGVLLRAGAFVCKGGGGWRRKKADHYRRLSAEVTRVLGGTPGDMGRLFFVSRGCVLVIFRVLIPAAGAHRIYPPTGETRLYHAERAW